MALSELSPRMLQCRTFGHAWKPSTVRYTTGARGTIIEYHAVLVCRDCKTEREQTLNAAGDVMGNRYRYPMKYVKPVDEDKSAWTKQAARLVFISQNIPSPEEN